MSSPEMRIDADATGIEVTSVGVRWFHPAGFLVDRPRGSGDYAFMQWLTRAKIRINGVTTVERPGGCVIYRPDDPQWFGGDVFTPFGNNWFHFRGSGVAPLLAGCRLPFNTIIQLRDDSFVEPLLNLFLRESMGQPRLWRLMLDSGARRFFVEMSRAIGGGSVRLRSARSAGLKDVFEDLRDILKARCSEPWTLKDMADRVHLSVSRFGRLYREFFGVNPNDDLIHMRIARAEYYLCMTNMPEGNVGELCGFSDSQYFSRQFKNKTGETPMEFRLLHGGVEGESVL